MRSIGVRRVLYGWVNGDAIYLIDLAVHISDEREECVDDGIEKTMCDPVRSFSLGR